MMIFMFADLLIKSNHFFVGDGLHRCSGGWHCWCHFGVAQVSFFIVLHKMSPTWHRKRKTVTSITLTFRLSRGKILHSMLAVDFSPPPPSVVLSLPWSLQCKLDLLMGCVVHLRLHNTTVPATALCLHPKEVHHESRVAGPTLHYRSKELPYCGRMCEWMSSFCSSMHPRFYVLTESTGWVCKDGKWTEMELPDFTAYMPFPHEGTSSF